LLIAIAEVESSMNPKAIGLNKRGGKVISEDVGLMQINSSWFPTLASMGITRNDLLNNPCQNVYVGAWILAKNIASNGVNWESVGAYNAGFKNANAPFRLKYAKKVYARYLILTGEG
jgi:soluble lytic murein transglycosylase-like protein